MPKETKRFINPLLRPTVEVETKREEVQTQPEQPASPEKTSTETSTNTYAPATPESEATSQRGKPPSNMRTTEVYSPAYRGAEQPSTETSTYHDEVERRRESRRGERPRFVREPATEVLEEEFTPSPTTVPSPMMQTSPLPSTSRSAESVSLSPKLASEASPVESPLPSTSTYTSTRRSVPAAEEERDMVGEPEYRARPFTSRRRRGAQAFEKTHERITLWVDKRLKQGFEELAYEQETSKTALLNEAIADLLRKYGLH